MLTERPLHTDIKTMLLGNAPFQYAHLIKFERPSRPDSTSGQVSTSKERYTYITDASRDVSFDDGSVNQSGVANGTQLYVANKVLKVSSVSEDTEAKANSFSIVLDGNGIGANISAAATITTVDATTWDITWPANTDLLYKGFREGDKITLTGLSTGSFNIYKFRAANVIRVRKIDVTPTTGTGSLTMSLSSDEIVSILLDKNASNYASFINREVFIYRAYFQNGAVVGAPFLLFKGIISAVGFDDGDTALTVTWTLSSHWGDFSQVKGRITSDDFHRALDQNGVPQPSSALKVAYAYDKGFSHSETSINILATYSVQVEKQDVKVKKGFLGIGSKVKVKKYFVTEGRNTELDFQLQAKSIPVIYGVRNTPGLPVFADTLNNDSSTVYVVQVLSEGEIGGIYDVYIDGNSLICNDKADFDTRSVQTSEETVKLICRGRADRGDVLGGSVSTSATIVPYYDTYPWSPVTAFAQRLNFDLLEKLNYPAYVEPVTTVIDNTGSGIIDGQSMFLSSPQEITMDIFSGKPGQKAASSLVTIAKANNFKIQNNYWNSTDTADYWGPNHRLMDTAYVVCKYKIKEGETTIPSTEFVVRGKTIECYNYDKSYSHDNKVTGESAANFNLGDTVALQTIAGATLNASVQIIDKWTFTNTDGTTNTRFRFSSDPALNYVEGVPLTTRFKMVSGANTWTMITYNYKLVEGTSTYEHIAPITAATNSSGYVQFGFSSNPNFIIGGDPTEQSSVFSVVDASGNAIENYFFGNAVLVGNITSTTLTTKYAWSVAGPSATAAIAKYLVRRNVVTLPTGSSATNDYYNGYLVTLTKIDATTGKKTTQTKKITDYDGASKIATIEGLWDYGMHPKSGDLVSLTPAYADSRVSINTAMQLMDYITSPTYGRNLDINKDLNFDSWLTTARTCDTQSNVTVETTGSVPSAAAVYKYPSTGTILWQGTVVGVDGAFVEFTSVLGKLTNAWNSWRSYTLNQLVHAESRLYLVTTAGVQATKPTHTSGTVAGLQYLGSAGLTKVSGTGPSTLALVIDGNPVRAVRNGSRVPGYSLYDADGVDYWRMLGWDQFDQRYVTKHQTNMMIDTSIPLLDNINSFLQHFGGIMRYSGGQYFLDIEEPSGVIANTVNEARNITADHIIGKIRLNDEGIRNSFNSLTAAYVDPANKFESRNISFFNSEYLKADRGVPKKGNLTIPGISNYYNTRILADKYLNKSRFGLSISFNMVPRGAILLAGQVVQLQYPRYGWVNKKFRISTLTHQEDATVDIVAEEYDDSFYALSRISKQAASGLAGGTGSVTAIDSPINLVATNAVSETEDILGVRLTWTNNPNLNGNKNAYTEIYSSYSSNLLLTISNITSNVLTSTVAHELKIGEPVIVQEGLSSTLLKGATYYVLTTPSTTTFTLSLDRNGTTLGITNDAAPNIIMNTSSLVSTVPINNENYIDIVSGLDSRITKYYWLRHKVLAE